MNPTDEVDDLLKRAGARWRADQPSAPEPDLDRLFTGGGRRPRRWVPALAAASVAVIAAAALIVLPGGKGDLPGPANAEGNQAQAPNDELLVRNGDKVKASGQLIAAPGKEPVLCAPVPKPAIGYLPGKEPAPDCPDQHAVILKGADVTKVAEPATTQGVRSGYTQVVGIWNDQTIEVEQQTVPKERSTTAELTIEPDQVPCAAPAGGWPTKPSSISDTAKLYLEEHADQIWGPQVYYPKGRSGSVVLGVGVAHGDPKVFHKAFEQVYDGNLCVFPVMLSRTDLERISAEIGKLMQQQRLGVYGVGSGAEPDTVRVDALVYDEALKAAVASISPEHLRFQVTVRPAG